MRRHLIGLLISALVMVSLALGPLVVDQVQYGSRIYQPVADWHPDTQQGERRYNVARGLLDAYGGDWVRIAIADPRNDMTGCPDGVAGCVWGDLIIVTADVRIDSFPKLIAHEYAHALGAGPWIIGDAPEIRELFSEPVKTDGTVRPWERLADCTAYHLLGYDPNAHYNYIGQGNRCSDEQDVVVRDLLRGRYLGPTYPRQFEEHRLGPKDISSYALVRPKPKHNTAHTPMMYWFPSDPR